MNSPILFSLLALLTGLTMPGPVTPASLPRAAEIRQNARLVARQRFLAPGIQQWVQDCTCYLRQSCQHSCGPPPCHPELPTPSTLTSCVSNASMNAPPTNAELCRPDRNNFHYHCFGTGVMVDRHIGLDCCFLLDQPWACEDMSVQMFTCSDGPTLCPGGMQGVSQHPGSPFRFPPPSNP
ncbi:uncharacterized protein LOC143274971 [Babylonia areolata]|uniref:uncharacterized protein LOC143274971 n=1 Tax=Babylonia areolata TaxID=304850 RepID=UPI003FD699E1